MMEQIGQQARAASRVLARSTGDARRSALLEMASALVEAEREILAANAADMDQAVVEGISGALIDRLRLTRPRVEAMAAGLRTVAALPDPVGQETGGWVMHNGIRLHRERVPLGVVAVIYEARPNVTADAAGLCIKSGNAVILRGSSYALGSNRAVCQVLRASLERAGLPEDGVQLLEDTTREGAKALMQATEWVDLLVPRGGPGLIDAVRADATVPTVIDGAGNCHVYVDAGGRSRQGSRHRGQRQGAASRCLQCGGDPARAFGCRRRVPSPSGQGAPRRSRRTSVATTSPSG